jgi:hypothetical protein
MVRMSVLIFHFVNDDFEGIHSDICDYSGEYEADFLNKNIKDGDWLPYRGGVHANKTNLERCLVPVR